MKILKKIFLILLIFLFSSVTTVYLYRAIESNQMRDLKKYHIESRATKLYNYVNYISISEYIDADKKYLEELYTELSEKENDISSKYHKKSVGNPYDNGENLNVSFQLIPKEIKGGVLLIHGLSDSPYSQRDIAEIFYKKGYYVLCLRLPGHGTVPHDLIRYTEIDWYKNVRFGMEKINEEMKKVKNPEIIMGGYSLGGALTLDYVLESLKNDKLTMPNKVFLFSPALGIPEVAKYGNLHSVLSNFPYFNKFAWNNISIEFDKYKTRSFPKKAAKSISNVVTKNSKILGKLSKENIEKLPPIYIYQTIADSTVKNSEIYKMYSKLDNNEKNNLYIFDINREYENVFSENYRELKIENIIVNYNIKSKVYFISNNTTKLSDFIYEDVYLMEENKPILKNRNKIKESWNEGEYSLSHIGMLYSPDNIYYGRNGILTKTNIKGEDGVHIYSYGWSRIRYNPIFNYLSDKISMNLENEYKTD